MKYKRVLLKISGEALKGDEPKLIIDSKTNKVLDIVNRVQGEAEKLIENFMIVANETVAGYIEDMKVPGIYRVHDKPNKEKLQVFLKFLNQKGYNFSKI